MLTRERLSREDWHAVRTTPHLVLLAVSATGGGPLHRMLERHAGMRGVTDAADSAHPLVRALADAPEIVEAQDEIQRWQVHLAFFSRKGFTPDAQRYLRISDVLAVDLKRSDADLR